MRRLYSTFARGPPGIGLLLIRLLAGTDTIVYGVTGMRGGPALGTVFLDLLWIGLGSATVVGLWTPIAGALLAVAALWNAFVQPEYRWYWIPLSTLGAAVALLGPGLWSVDARLFGWKRLEIRNRERPKANEDSRQS